MKLIQKRKLLRKEPKKKTLIKRKSEINVPAGIYFVLGGTSEMNRDAFNDLAQALIKDSKEKGYSIIATILGYQSISTMGNVRADFGWYIYGNVTEEYLAEFVLEQTGEYPTGASMMDEIMEDIRSD